MTSLTSKNKHFIMNNQEQVSQQENNDEIKEVLEPKLAQKAEEAQQESIEELKKQIEELKDKLLRQLAETENLRTRSARLIEEAKDYAIFSFCKDMVSVMDNLTRALEHVPSDISNEVKNVIEGIVMTKKELASVFQKHSLEVVDPVPGEKFDYNSHHAIAQITTDEYEADNIVNTMQVGYKIKNRLIRPAAVSVSVGK